MRKRPVSNHRVAQRFARCPLGPLCVLCVPLILAFVAAGCTSSHETDDEVLSVSPTTENQVQLQTLDIAGLRRLISSHSDKIVVVDLWAGYCRPCKEEFHNLVELHNEYGSEKLACISLSLDNQGLKPINEVVPDVLAFLKKQNATFDNVIAQEEAEEVYRQLNVVNIPTVMVYDDKGSLVETVTPADGTSPYLRVRELLNDLIAE